MVHLSQLDRYFKFKRTETVPPIDWTAIINAIIQAIKDCQNPTPASLRHRGPLAEFRYQRSVREGSGLTRAEWRTKGDGILAQLKTDLTAATDADLQSLIDEAKAA